ncbi:kinesin-like protein KIF25 isoform X6 [Felis catus]|uniref:kinesin-like protein KIF25 isoform X6 n=1 Tax=Felis catus TaxID=9685 RepID=UPI001D1A3169|nr:kinesin-like protein KIF25 isoform X6 [Felis catus]
MPAATGGRWGRFWEQRAQQLQRQVQAKEEWIVDLETENAVLHLRLAQYQGAAGQSGSASAGLCSLCGPRARLPRSPHAALLRLRPVIQALKQDVKALHASFLEVFRNFWDHLQTGLSEVAEGVQRAQLQHQALLSWRSEAGHLERCLQEADSRYQLEKQRRKVLHNRLVELKGNIRVHCRIRPLLPFDEESEDPASQNSSVPAEVVHAVDDETVLVKCDRAAHPPINNTYSFERLISENPSRSLKVDVSIVEVYNNNIFDLLAKDGRTAASGPKREVLTAQEAKQEVCLLTREPVHSAAEFMALAAGSLQLRAELATSVHANSSRSHLIITATLTTAPARGSPGAHHPPAAEQQANGPRPEGSRRRASGGRAWPGALGAQRPAEQVHAKLQLVDLAGSECVGVSGVTGSALRETSFINRSLAALEDVLGALAERRGHVPYRNSKLTHFLQDVLGGDAKLLVILCVSPCRKHVAETLRCLGFGARARQVQRGQARGGSPAPRKPR